MSLQDFEMAALALDAYHRGYYAGMPDVVSDDGLGAIPNISAVAGGVVIASSADLGDGVDIAADFYAVAYLIGNEVVISYRGSDHLHFVVNPDGSTSWSGADAADVSEMQMGLIPDQVELALDFFNHVKALNPSLPITITGHSLGGALAATVADLKNANAVVFDNTAYIATVSTVIQQVSNSNPDLYNEIRDKVFNGETAWTDFRQGTITKIALEGDIAGVFRQSDTNVDNVDMGTALDPVSAHIQGLLVLALYARSQHGETGEWTNAANAVFTALSSDAIAAGLGVLSANGNPRSGVMKNMIASTVLPGGDNPFGDSAANALVDDMQHLGLAVLTSADLESVARLVVRFAALQAKHGVAGSTEKALDYDAGNHLLSIDLTQAKWTFDGNLATMDGFARDFSSYLNDQHLNTIEKVNLDSGPGRVEFEYYSSAVGGWHGQIDHESSIYTVKAVGTATQDTIIGTDGDEQIILGGGDDTVKANGGVNWINGGVGTDKLIDDHAWSDFQIQFDAVQQRYYFALRESGTDPRIHILDDMELFQLDGQLFDAANVMNVGPDGSVFASGGLYYEGVLTAGSEVARLGALDGNAFDAFTWTLHPDTLAHYYLDGNIVRALHDITFDYEAYIGLLGGPITDLVGGISPDTGWQDILAFIQSAYVVKVTVEDSYGFTASTNLAIGIANVNEAPQGVRIVNTSGTVVEDWATLPENLPIGTLVGTALAGDPDGDDQITWSLVNDAGGRFRIDAVTGEIFVNGVLDHEELSSLELIARATDIHGAFGDTALAITLEDVEEVINGTEGEDTLYGTPGMDVINGLGGHDTIYGHEANDRLYGGVGNDAFYGGTGSDAMFGEADNDTFHLGEAEAGDVEYVNGGAHTGTGDVVEVSVGATYRLDAAGAAAIRNQIVANGFAAPTGHGIGIEMAVGDAFVQGVEIIRASADANELVIGTASDLAAAGAKTFDFTAGADDSVLYSGEMPATLTLSGDNGRSKAVQAGATATSFLGVDEWNLTASGNSVTVDKSHLGQQPVTINAGPGIDLLNLSSFTTEIVFGLTPVVGGTNITATGFERVYGGSGNDTFHGTNADEMFLGNGGTNTFYGSLGADYLSSSGGNLIVDYSLSAEAVIFMRSSSTSTSAVAHASMSAGSMGYGDTLVASGWSDITGSEGADTLLVVGTHGTLRSNGGTDTLIGNKNSDTLVGADGYAEIMRPGDGNDTIQFGTGGGTLDFSTSTRAAVIDLLEGTFVFGDQFDTVTGDFDKVIGTASGDDIRGTEGADTIDGGSGTGYDVIYGRGGADTITFRNGVVRGGTGNDVISSTQSSTIVFGEDDDDTISVGKDSLVYGGGGNDSITAGEGSTIYGDDGADTINVSAKFVTVHGGSGGDVINISAISWYAMSTLSYSQSDAGVSVVRAGNGFLASGGHAEGDQLSGKFSVVGSDFADVFDLDVSDIGFIKAGSGDDVITLRLTDGEAYGESGDDSITLTSRHQDAFGGDGNDTFHGYGRMFGGEGDDEFYLGYGNYAAGPFSHVKVGGTVRGGSGQNYIEGGAGNDTIWMDEGSDTFIYSSGGGHDQIYMAGPDDHLILDGVAGFSSISDIAANLFEDASRTELRFDGFEQKIGFMNMTANQVLALDWAFV